MIPAERFDEEFLIFYIFRVIFVVINTIESIVKCLDLYVKGLLRDSTVANIL